MTSPTASPTSFSLNRAGLLAGSERAALRSDSGEGGDLFEKLRASEPLDGESLATLFLSADIATDTLRALASERLRSAAAPMDSMQIETFSPLYISNECDAECKMCGMRRFNTQLQRSTADDATVRDQIDILHQRGIRGVAVLTGEYRHGARRQEMLERAGSAADYALERGFGHVLINVGSLESEEYDAVFASIARESDGSFSPHVTMCTFQETYDREVYGRFMGSSSQNPRSDFERRLTNFDRAAQAGMRSANPGVLLGLNPDLAFELMALVSHVEHLLSLGLQVYISLPRLRKASGAEHRGGASDDDLTRIVCLLSARFPEAKVVISTRESPEIQQHLLPVIRVLTAGSPGVAPYDEASARFELEASQFEVADQRPFELILGECLAAGATIEGYEPAASASHPAG
jgi:2-iminoacetate synthase